ncbi:hypothetical protein [Patulibacter medicamentivorans]|uniref:hypothetical protein n=1 Tax=Patulibacter medicamentivorans TaxID=1097667 RepID=UPI00058F3B3D|nr:hypothetical protein [Patulibacter medicamentivorans]
MRSKLAIGSAFAVLALGAGASSAGAVVTISDGNGTPGFNGDGTGQYFDIQGGAAVECANVATTDGTIDSPSSPAKVSFTPSYTNCQAFIGGTYTASVTTVGKWAIQVKSNTDPGPAYEGNITLPAAGGSNVIRINVPAISCTINATLGQTFSDGAAISNWGGSGGASNQVGYAQNSGSDVEIFAQVGDVAVTDTGCPSSVGAYGFYDSIDPSTGDGVFGRAISIAP